MSISVDWENEEKTSVIFEFENRWDWTEFYNALAEGNGMLDQIDYKVGVIIDLRNSSIVPKGALTQINGMRNRVHPNIDLTILFGANRLLQSIYDIFQKIRPTPPDKFLMVASLEDARAILKERLVVK